MRFRMIAAPLAAIFVLALVFPPRADARQEEGAGEAPVLCPQVIHAKGWFQSVYFSLVPMTRSDPYIASTNDYKNNSELVVSDNKKWLWSNGGGTFNCWKWGFWPYLEGQTLVPPSDGAMIPGPDEEATSSEGPPSGTGGAERQWSTGVSSGGGTIVCEVTDWYQGSVYIETEINYCWVRYF